jgi:uncharacterized damage-inducible protein DinB
MLIMDTMTHFHRLFAYDAWANQEILTALRPLENPPQRSLAFLAHIFSAERLWWQRIVRQQQTLPVWPQINLQECGKQAAELTVIWKKYLGTTSESDLSSPVTYNNSQGETWTSTVDDILQHVIMHSMYHRGQIATDMRAAGLTPVCSDFIHAVRQKHIE